MVGRIEPEDVPKPEYPLWFAFDCSGVSLTICSFLLFTGFSSKR